MTKKRGRRSKKDSKARNNGGLSIVITLCVAAWLGSLVWVAQLDFNLITYTVFYHIAIAGAILGFCAYMFMLLTGKGRGGKWKPWYHLFSLPLAILISALTVTLFAGVPMVLINCKMDTSQPVTTTALISKVHQQRSRSKKKRVRYAVTLSPNHPRFGGIKTNIAAGTFPLVEPGKSRLLITYYKGFFGYPWMKNLPALAPDFNHDDRV